VIVEARAAKETAEDGGLRYSVTNGSMAGEGILLVLQRGRTGVLGSVRLGSGMENANEGRRIPEVFSLPSSLFSVFSQLQLSSTQFGANRGVERVLILPSIMLLNRPHLFISSLFCLLQLVMYNNHSERHM